MKLFQDDAQTVPVAKPAFGGAWSELSNSHAEAMGSSWKDHNKVAEYTGRVGRLAARRAGETELLEALPDAVANDRRSRLW